MKSRDRKVIEISLYLKKKEAPKSKPTAPPTKEELELLRDIDNVAESLQRLRAKGLTKDSYAKAEDRFINLLVYFLNNCSMRP